VRRVAVSNPTGFHVRPATQVRARAIAFRCEIGLTLVAAPAGYRGTQVGVRADAKNILEMISLTSPQGTCFEIDAEGEDAAEAVEALAALFASGFDVD
jgi:phosphotransferase system HPr (HPr) family protein